MPLFLIATPIGNKDDISLRAVETIRQAQAAIVESRKESMALLRRHGFEGHEVFELNHHTTGAELSDLVRLCREKKVIQVSDCGTPGFEDPGNALVDQCRKQGIQVHCLPGASSLTALLSLSGKPLRQFFVAGFLPKTGTERTDALRELQRRKEAFVLMETPYRCLQLLAELTEYFPHRRILFAAELTTPQELVLEGTPQEALKHVKSLGENPKLEFIVLIYGEVPRSSSK